MKRQALLIIGAILAGSPSYGKEFTVSVSAGDAIPLGFVSRDVGHTAAIGAQAYYNVSDSFALGLETGYMFPAKIQGDDLGSALRIPIDVDGDGVSDKVAFDSNSHVFVFHLTPGFKISHTIETGHVRWKPYIGMAGGFYYTHSDDGTVTLHGTTSGGFALPAPRPGVIAITPIQTLRAEGVINSVAGFNLGAGADCLLGDHLRAGIDIRYHQLIFSNAPDLQYLIPALRLAFAF